jgi:hypothetical protein
MFLKTGRFPQRLEAAPENKPVIAVVNRCATQSGAADSFVIFYVHLLRFFLLERFPQYPEDHAFSQQCVDALRRQSSV